MGFLFIIVKRFLDSSVYAFFWHYSDLFYELLREWEDKHLTAGWSVLTNQQSKIWSLVHNIPGNDLSIHLHFVRLFVLQLVQVNWHSTLWTFLSS